MKYDFELELHEVNSLSLISKKIKPGSYVLEFGPATGRLTRYLKQHLECRIDIVEIDKESADLAIPYVNDAVIGNIEDYEWYQKFISRCYDHIIFADVLEHLIDPVKALKKAASLLNENGTILISVPNIAHNSVIIDLLNNKFRYKDIGLLDETHVKFFTYENLLNTIEQTGLRVLHEQAVYKKVEETEFDNFYDQVPTPVGKFLKNRPYSEVYQFVFELGNKTHEAVQTLKNIKDHFNCYISQLYVDVGQGFTEGQCAIKEIRPNIKELVFSVDSFNGIKQFRFDPINTNAIIRINKIAVMDINERFYEVSDFVTNAAYQLRDIFVFATEDPQVYFTAPLENDISKIIIKIDILELEYENNIFWLTLLNDIKTEELKLASEAVFLKSNVEDLKREKIALTTDLQDKDREIEGLVSRLHELEREKKEALSKIEAAEKNIESLRIELDHYNESLVKLNKENVKVKEQNADLNVRLDELMNSKGWKAVQKLRKIKSSFLK
ncbi:glycosyl transferase, group 2 family protein [Paenibacillus mucilaginosus 3016]|uniref:Glycosyl transferase, group 2 family protein n=1 Tax=Paenibacillus mucilaginosus 3016 TaxID=1116391 RepID=H6NSX5_9BACL|nr:class I SAM-dependent methyltransferase [Paenibacillus mucilaginosus]AFC27516.1 glycosyl transferase, group 2 family protein [Paenibacillus mucilaginosus 3016]